MSQLDLQEVAKTFGFIQAPKVELRKFFADLYGFILILSNLFVELSHKFKKEHKKLLSQVLVRKRTKKAAKDEKN